MDIQTITKEEVQQKMGQPNVIVYNVLSKASYDTIHIKGSESMPLEELEAGAWEKLDKTKEIIVYCADYDCKTSKKAALLLGSKGFNVRAYEGGVKEWSESGLPVEGEILTRFRIKPKTPPV